VGDDAFAKADKLTQETSLTVVGTVKEHGKRKGEFELGVKSFEVIGAPSQEYPISPKDHGTDFLMDNRHLWLRSKRQHAIMRVRHTIVKAVRDFFDEDGFTLLDAPIFTPNACEGTSTLFETDYHGEPAYLTQSGQLYMEAGAAAFGKVYCFGPTFRAEKSKTRRHLAEFWMVEPEVAYADLDDVITLAEGLITSVVARVLETRRTELAILERDTAKLEAITGPFPRLTYDDAARILQEKGLPFQYGTDLGGTDETVLSEQFDRPVCVTHYPASVKAFYMKPDPAHPDKALCVDVLAPEGYGEIIGGGQRLDDLDLLLQRIKEHELPQEAFEWYLDLRRYGTVPHGGFGMGIERCVSWICKLDHVRETIPYPRMLYRLYP
jgi:asparaginyl-tRNA synthetase